MHNVVSVNGIPTCTHPNERTTIGPTTTQINHFCPDCKQSWTTFPEASKGAEAVACRIVMGAPDPITGEPLPVDPAPSEPEAQKLANHVWLLTVMGDWDFKMPAGAIDQIAARLTPASSAAEAQKAVAKVRVTDGHWSRGSYFETKTWHVDGLKGIESLPDGALLYAFPSPAASMEVQGLAVAQEPKYTVNGSAIVNRASSEAIPGDEPVFIFRARDWKALHALREYQGHCVDSNHRAAVTGRIQDFKDFAAAHPERMKEPDTAASPAPAASKGAEADSWVQVDVPAPTAAWTPNHYCPDCPDGANCQPPSEPEAQKAVASLEWTAKVSSDGRQIVIDSADFEHDALLILHGDFGSMAGKLDYAKELADKLNAPRPAASMEVQGLTEQEVGACIDEVNANSEYGTHHFGWHKQLAASVARALAAKNGWRLGEGRE